MKAPDLQPVRSVHANPVQRAVQQRGRELAWDERAAVAWLSGRARSRGFLARLIGR